MTIACLAWGSLFWNPGGLPIEGDWQVDGPPLPLEFARQSDDGRMTLVITESALSVPVLWAPLRTDNLADAINALAKREKVTRLASIGRVPDGGNYSCADVITTWAGARGLTGVVWTALQPGMKGMRGQVPTLAEIKPHLDKLSSAARAKALEYLHRAPAQIETAYRTPLTTMLSETIQFTPAVWS